MNKKLIRAALVVASTGTVAAGIATGAGAAAAAPGNLVVTAYSKCVTSHDRPGTDRVVFVRNTGDTTVKHVRVGELNGPEHSIPRLAEDQEIGPRSNGMRYYSATGVRKAGELAPGESIKTWHVVPGCTGPWAIAGYALSNPMDNPAGNADIRWSATKPPRETN
ncbi:hypothetical protein [Gordonia sp. (in: high G+C Gram-positive bacteria)]|uniref:hypothetical protein n=1 Tax=Gordonia sp. (in: high G+C Gram-positive bacteria) TaxID=84139 RepID=UPI0016AB77F4|nr:hypothetical protein [Gordonia sp. (in: high G+C Gram-positive bacteria)]NLG47893.1 hypothetical protein [Gordonia sp. (in: high G+C Gram-positive bacteria)]